MLLGVHGVGPEFASVLWSEGLSRHLDNRRQVAAYAGLAPTPWQSGWVNREQGISQSGNPRLRTMMIQLAWLWLRHQPRSGPGDERFVKAGVILPPDQLIAVVRAARSPDPDSKPRTITSSGAEDWRLQILKPALGGILSKDPENAAEIDQII
jgi:transposase